MGTMKRATIARHIYRFLNETYFDGVLPEPLKFKFVPAKNFIAGVSTNGNIYFSTFYHYDHVEIMLHEMCHVWQFVTGGQDTHGKTFKEIALDISQQSGYNIQEFQQYFHID